MEELAVKLSKALTVLFNNKMPNWNSGSYVVKAESSINKSYRIGIKLFDVKRDELVIDNKIEYFLEREDDLFLIELIIEANKDKKVNVVEFTFINKVESSISYRWDQSIQDEFDQYLPKSKKGKIKAWYLP